MSARIGYRQVNVLTLFLATLSLGVQLGFMKYDIQSVDEWIVFSTIAVIISTTIILIADLR